MKHKLLVVSSLALLFCVSCSTIYTGIVTVTDVVDGAMKEWAVASKKGVTGPKVDEQVVKAHDTYRKSCTAAAEALRAFKYSGDPTTYNKAVDMAKQAAQQVIELIVPFVTKSQGEKLQSDMEKAKVLQ